MAAEFALRLALAACVLLLAIGVTAAWSSNNVAKRMGGLLAAQISALIGLATLSAPSGAMIAGVVVMFVTLSIGAALLVRLQESYGGVETPEFDGADEKAEPREPGA